MPFPLLGWVAVAVGGAIIAAIASDDDDSNNSSGKSTYKKSIDTEIKKRNTARRETIQKSVANATCEMWRKQVNILAEEGLTLLFFSTKDGLQNINHELIANDYSIFLFDEALVKEKVQEIRAYVAIGGKVSELEPAESSFHTINTKFANLEETLLNENAFKSLQEYLKLFTQNENDLFFELITPMIKCYKIKSCFHDLDDKLNKYNELYGEREGLESDNTYIVSNDAAITKIKTDYM